MRSEENIMYMLRGLYESFGYSRYKMSKFEEYDLYAGNKDLLESEGIITFTDTNGKLMALKPDVTLSIIRNTRDRDAYVSKVYYNENVYRVSASSKAYKEIMQTGLECVGAIDDCCVLEVISLAAKSLAAISKDSILCVSLPRIAEGIAKKAGLAGEKLAEALKLAAGKNVHELTALMKSCGCSECDIEKLSALASLSGSAEQVLPKLKELGAEETDIKQIELIAKGLCYMGLSGMLSFDFSTECGTRYYSGVVFKGYVSGVPSAVISGGRYDALMNRMGKKSGAIGFAVYLDAIERLLDAPAGFDADVLLLYKESDDAFKVLKKAEELSSSGKKVMIQRAVPEDLMFREVMEFKGEEA